MTTTLDLPTDLMRALEQHAANHGQDLSETVAGRLRTALGRADADAGLPRPVIRRNPKYGLPYLESVHAAHDDSPRRVHGRNNTRHHRDWRAKRFVGCRDESNLRRSLLGFPNEGRLRPRPCGGRL
jgi:hypothetical protein